MRQSLPGARIRQVWRKGKIVGVIVGVVIVVVLAVIAGAVFFLRKKTKKAPFPRYSEKALFSKNETVLFGRLCRALPHCYIFPHVPLSAIVEPLESDRLRNPEHFEKITALKVDFAVCDGDMELVCVVILEPEASDARRDRLAEKCLKSASIKIIRWSAATKPSVEQIGRAILPLTSGAKPSLETSSTINPDTVQMIYKSEPIPSNIRGLSQEQLDLLTPDKILSKNYPHIWQRICLFAPEPKHLQKYLLSLSIQDRGEKRAGFPLEALKEIADIQTENDRFLLQPVVGWQPAFVNR
jgi:hypothetical protein